MRTQILGLLQGSQELKNGLICVEEKSTNYYTIIIIPFETIVYVEALSCHKLHFMMITSM